MITISCFGEILWDNFPTYRRIGGAPLNVALRMHSFGADVHMISRLGQDRDGKEILTYLNEQGLSTDLIQKDPHNRTGTVDVHLDDTRTATYTINKPVAWDAIELNPAMMEAVSNSDALIYGSLATRSEDSEQTLKAVVKEARFKVFDMNLRPPHYRMERLIEFLRSADLIKLNDEELEELSSHLQLPGESIDQKMRQLCEWLFGDIMLCVTKGAEGAQLLLNNKMYLNPGYPVKVADTVGAGDSFLATLCYQILSGTPPQESLDLACAIGSLVASKEGAIPHITQGEIDSLVRIP